MYYKNPELINHRIKNFNCRIEPCRHPIVENELNLSVTHNGKQWSTISLTPDEAKTVIMRLKEYLEEKDD